MVPYSLYLHIPFCRKRCSYCDFNTCAGFEQHIPAYLSALATEIDKVAAASLTRLPVHTVYFGGGTPSLLLTAQVEAVLQTINTRFDVQDGAEITLEANPGTVSLGQLRDLRAAGVNRLSFGMQSAHADELLLLERLHDHVGVIEAVKWARQAGFDNLSLDLIYGLPGQTLERWQFSLEMAVQLAPEHLSLYSLTLDEGTQLHRWASRGLVNWPDDDLMADMYLWAMDWLEDEGYRQYEIANFARMSPNGTGEILASRHNLQYWRNQPYLGFGAGAHGSAEKLRVANAIDLQQYIAQCRTNQVDRFPVGPAAADVIEIDRMSEMQETMMVGLRLTDEGVSSQGFRARFGVEMMEVFGKEIAELIDLGLVEWGKDGDKRLRLTKHGRPLGNQAFMRFV
jgi:putative oxygen-independent coproporphyrinogen III oxidase